MSLAQLRYQLEALEDANAGGRSVDWKVLYANRSQPLLVAPDISAARHSINFFVRNPILRLWGRMALLVDSWLPQLGLLPTLRLHQFPASLTDDVDICPAMYVGCPGPLQKLTLYCPKSEDSTDKVTKVALSPTANEAIAREAYWLGTLGKLPELTPFMPRLLGAGTLSSGLGYLSMQALPQGVSSRHFDRRHRHFLRLLSQHRPHLTPWLQSGAHLRLRERMQRALPLMDAEHQELLLTVLDEVEHEIGPQRLPTCLLHSDFAPWNVRLAQQQLYVFDWEYAEESGNPLQDFLHFHLIQRALGYLPPGPAGMPPLLSETAAYARAVFGKDSGVAEACGALTLHYLLDTLTFYTTASGYLAPRHPVIRAYLELLRRRAEWLPQSMMKETIRHGEQQRAV